MTIDQDQLRKQLSEHAEALDVPGVSVGVYHAGEEQYAYHGVTSVENPLPVDENTLFQYGSTHKTFTATAIMRLVEQGKIDLDATVRTYVPELKLKDEHAAENVTVLQLLNHTAGWSGDAPEDTGAGDDARAKFVESMIDFEQVTPLGATVSYNNASLNLAGRVIEKVTGKVYETAMKELIYDPLRLESTFFFPNDVMTRRFVVGHQQNQEDGTIKVARPWALARAGAPAGGFGVSANAGDQIKWARFHLGDGTAPDGTRLLSKESLDRMKQPTFEMPGSALGDAVGISWLLEDVGGTRLVGHGGTTIGQYSEFLMSPENDFALISMTNCGPNGAQFNRRFQKWVLETVLGIVSDEPEAIMLGDAALAEYTGTYETVAVWAHITAEDGKLVLNVEVKPEAAKRMREEGEEVPDQPPIPMGMLEGKGDRYVVTDGPAKGMKGYFMRAASGEVNAVHVGGRLATRVAAQVPA
jgi:CubicO group peptidase (beta-lactamase class C family)